MAKRNKKNQFLSNRQNFWFLIILTAFLCFTHFCSRPKINTYEDAKRILETKIYFDHPFTIYCGAEYDDEKNIELPEGVKLKRFIKRGMRMEWEHAAPVEKWGKNFREWKDGNPECEKDGKRFYGRKCARLINREFRKMEADMYNLFPSIGAVNAARNNKEYGITQSPDFEFGACRVKMDKNTFEPPDWAKGQVARASLYMADRYEKYVLPEGQRIILQDWNRRFPADGWECERGKRIKKLQGNANPYIEESCAPEKEKDQISLFHKD